MCTFCFCLCYVGERKRENMKNMEKRKVQKQKTEKLCFLGGCEQRRCFCRNGISFEKKANTLCVRKVKTHSIFVATICFISLCPFKVTKHYKNRGFSRHRGKPKMAFLVAKVPFWEGASQGASLSVIPRSCALLKTLFL